MKSRRTHRQKKTSRKQLRHRKQHGRGLSDVLPTTTWGNWGNYPGAVAWSSTSQAPAPLANGGLYTNPQSTGPWASHPMPATQYAFAVEAAETARNPTVFYQQRPVDNQGASFSPYVGVPASSSHYSSTMGPWSGGKQRKQTKQTRRNNRR